MRKIQSRDQAKEVEKDALNVLRIAISLFLVMGVIFFLRGQRFAAMEFVIEGIFYLISTVLVDVVRRSWVLYLFSTLLAAAFVLNLLRLTQGFVYFPGFLLSLGLFVVSLRLIQARRYLAA